MSRERRLKRNKVLYSDAVPSTDLPPLVQGELRCFLSLVVGKITWGTSYKTPICPAYIKLRWWGEVSDGTILRPEIESDGSVIKSRAKFAIRSGPKQMSAYFNDMETINLEILASPNAVPLAFVHIPRLQDLTSNNPIEGKFPIISLSSRKLGEIEVGLHFKSIHDAFDNKLETVVSQPPIKLSSSTRTSRHNSSCNSIRSRSSSREGSIKRGRKARSRQKSTTTGGRKKSVSLERKRSVSNDSKKSSQISTKSNQSSRTKRKKKIITPRGVDEMLQAEGHDLYRVASPLISDNDDEDAAENRATKQPKEPPRPSNQQQEKEVPRSSVAPPPPPQDLPTRLSGYAPPSRHVSYADRNKMVEQSLLNLNYMREINKKKLDEEKLLKTPNVTSDMRMIELMFGSNMLSHYNNDDDNDTTSFYSAPVSIFSDGEDPLHDSKLLDQLFYNRMGFYREEVLKMNENLCADRQLSSLVDGALLAHKRKEEVKELDKVDISTRSLQAVRSIRVTIHCLKIAMKNCRKQMGKHSKSKPPSSKRRSFYVDYKLPGFDFIRCASKDQPGNSRGDGETTVVRFDEETNFPISFDPELVRIWLQTSLAFVLFENGGQQATTGKKKEIGMVKLQLCDVINAPNHAYRSDLLMTRDETYSLGVSIDLVMGAAKQQVTVSYPSCSHQHTDVIPDSKRFAINNKPKQVRPRYYDQEENVQTQHLSCQILCFYLSIKNARDIPGIQIGKKLIDPNTFLVTKFFASEQVGKTATIWSTSNPIFNFNQFVPVQINANLFKRMGNNYVIIEIWTRISKTDNDKLIGIVKVSLNIFHQSLVNEDIARSVLSTQYPMISCDGYQDIVDLFTGTLRGKLNVLLALGTKEQIEQLRKIKEFDTATAGVTSSNDQQQDDDVIVANLCDDVSNMEKLHCIQVKIRGLKNFKPQDDQIYGETDCFIRYRFPTLDADSGNKLATLCEYSTESTLCTPEPQFNYETSHHYNSTIPLHVLLRNACSGVGKYPGGGIPFELWSRFYYPNVRDQLVAKGILPVAKLIPLIGGLNNEKTKKENFQIAMTLVETTSSNYDVIGGQLSVSVEYLHGDDVTELLERHGDDDVITVDMEITRCCGLKAALQHLIDDDVIDGCECYVTIKPPHSLMSSNKNIEIERKLVTSCVKSKQFAPQFHHRLSLSAPLLRHRGSDDVISLGEVIAKEIVEVEIWQKRRRRNADDTSSCNDVIIGNVKIDLSWLLVRTNGIHGWFPIKSLRHSTDDVTHPVGGIELSLRLANGGDDQKKLLLSSNTKFPREFPSSHLLMTSSATNRLQPLAMTSSLCNQHSHVTICVNVTSLQLLRCDADDVGAATRMYYVRYKLHGHDTVTSRDLTKPVVRDDVTSTWSVSVAHRQLYLSEIDETLIFNLREKPLQLQLWCRGHHHDDDDVLVGTTYVDMSPLLDGRLQRHQRAGGEILPLYGADVSDIRSATLRCYITSTPGDHTNLQADDDVINVTTTTTSSKDVFTASILVERGMHMPDDVTSTVRVTYEDAKGRPHTTSSQVAASNPRWDEVHQVQLATQLLSQGGVVMRVAYGADDVIVGTATVDVSLLTTPGFSMINGWYNVIDAHGGCHGQLKIAVSPTSDLSDVIVAKPPVRSSSSSEAAKHRHHGCKLAAPLVVTPSGSVCYVPGVDRGDSGADLSEVLRRKMRELDEIRRSFDRKIRALNNHDDVINTMSSPPRCSITADDDAAKFLSSTPFAGDNSAAAKRSALRSPEADDDDDVIPNDDDDEVEVVEPRNLNLMTSQSMCSSIHDDDTSLFHSTAPHHDDVTINEANNDDVIVEMAAANDETSSTIANDDVSTETPPPEPHDDDDVIEYNDDDVITDEDDAVGDCDVIKEDEVDGSDDDEEEENEETSIFSDDDDDDDDDVTSNVDDDVVEDEEVETTQQQQVETPPLDIAVVERENLKTKFQKKSTSASSLSERRNVEHLRRIPSFFPPTQNLMEKMKCLREFTNQQQLKIDLASEYDSHNTSSVTSSTSLLTSSTRSDRRRLVAAHASADREGTKRLERIFKSKFSSKN